MAEMTTLAVKHVFANSKIIGEKTWGGTGQIPPTDVRYLGGQFTAVDVFFSDDLGPGLPGSTFRYGSTARLPAV